jgi:hypothetical protein
MASIKVDDRHLAVVDLDCDHGFWNVFLKFANRFIIQQWRGVESQHLRNLTFYTSRMEGSCPPATVLFWYWLIQPTAYQFCNRFAGLSEARNHHIHPVGLTYTVIKLYG